MGVPCIQSWALRPTGDRSASNGRWLIAAVAVVLASAAQANPVLDWNALMLGAIRADNSGPTLSTRNLAILDASLYDAVNSVARTHQPYLSLLDNPPGTSPEAAVIAAGREVMLTLYPSFQARTLSLYEEGLSALPASVATTNGVALGKQVADLMLEARQGDGANTQVPYIPSDAPGQWRRTPPFYRPPLDPHWRYVKLFALPDKESFLPPPPPPLTSEQYAQDFNEVKAIGGVNSQVRTAEQSQIAVFWSDFSYTAMPPGHWHEIAANIVRSRNTSFEDSARLMALISLAQADAAIVCWEIKYRYNTWRPVTAIRRADEDGNPATDPDPNWKDYLNAPNFPEYVSGHSTFSKASAEVLARFYGTDAITFSATSDSLPGVFRTFTSLAACANEVGMSRIYGGIHYQSANREGKATGARVGDFVSANFLLANDALPFVRLEGMTNGAPRLRLHGHIGHTLVLDKSSDLAHWAPLSTNSAAVGGVVVADPDAGQQPCFYRTREF